MVGVALYKPDIPQNTGAIVRFCACFGIKLHIIEPCGFNINDKRFKRVTLDYREICEIIRYDDYKSFTEDYKGSVTYLNARGFDRKCKITPTLIESVKFILSEFNVAY